MISALLAALWWAALVLTVAAAAYLLLALAAVASLRPRFGPGWHEPPRVTVLKPMCGREDGLEQAVESFLSQELTSPVRFVFGFADASDPALVQCRQVADCFPDRDVACVVDPTVHGPNPKVSNLVNMAQLGVITLVWYFQQNYDVGYTSI